MKRDQDHAALRRRNARRIASGAESVQQQQERCAFIAEPRRAKWVMSVPDEEIAVFSPCASR